MKRKDKKRHVSTWWGVIGGLLLLGVPALTSCELINPEEQVPAYLYLDTFSFRTEPAEGSASEKITEGWLFVDGRFLGAYTLPSLVPVLETGEREIALRPGILDNGISRTPETYPFYREYEQRVDLNANEVDTLQPSTRYDSRTRFSFIEDFESGTPIFQDLRIGAPENELRPVENEAFEGRYAGRIKLSVENPVVELATAGRYRDLTENGFSVYLELNYKSEVPVIFGLIGYDDTLPGIGVPVFEPGFLPRESWNKIYFNLSSLILQDDFDEYQIALRATLPQENGVFTMEEAYIWLDNIKLVHF